MSTSGKKTVGLGTAKCKIDGLPNCGSIQAQYEGRAFAKVA
jgi:hypothetical protein